MYFLPYRLTGRKLRFTQYELTLTSLSISILIFLFSLKTYQLLSPIFNLNEMVLSSISITDLIDNLAFLILLLLHTILFLILGLYFIPQDRMVKIRNKIAGASRKLQPGDSVWDIAFDGHGGHVIVQTNENDFFLGFARSYSSEPERNKILLKYPQKYDIVNNNRTPLKQFDSILFLKDDIKRIYFIQ